MILHMHVLSDIEDAGPMRELLYAFTYAGPGDAGYKHIAERRRHARIVVHRRAQMAAAFVCVFFACMAG